MTNSRPGNGCEQPREEPLELLLAGHREVQRHEHLNGWQFDSLLKAQVLTEDWRVDYNTRRPHSALDNLTPTTFRQAWTTRFSPQPNPAQ